MGTDSGTTVGTTSGTTIGTTGQTTSWTTSGSTSWTTSGATSGTTSGTTDADSNGVPDPIDAFLAGNPNLVTCTNFGPVAVGGSASYPLDSVFPIGGNVSVFMFSTPVELYNGEVPSSRSVLLTIPADTEPGRHKFIQYGQDADGNFHVSGCVSDLPQVLSKTETNNNGSGGGTGSGSGTGTGSGSTPGSRTGSNSAGLMLVGGSLLLLGGSLVIGGRRRRRQVD